MSNRVSVEIPIRMATDRLGLTSVSRFLDSMYEWAFWAEFLIGSRGGGLIQDECQLEVENNRAKLPCGFYQLISINAGGGLAEFNGGDFRFFYKDSPYLASETLSPAVYSPGSKQPLKYGPFKFTVNSKYIDLDMQSGTIGIAYMKFPLDEEGKITIAAGHELAVSRYIEYNIISQQYFRGKAPEHLYRNIEREWKELCAYVYGDDAMPSREEMEFAGMIWNSHFPINAR